MLATPYRLSARPPAKSTGSYTRISIAELPIKATAGSIISAQCLITNNYSAPISIMGAIYYEYGGQIYPVTYTGDQVGVVNPDNALLVTGYFTMPLANVVIHFDSYYMADQWYLDTTDSVAIEAIGQNNWAQLDRTTIYIELPPVTLSWAKLASQNVQVDINQIATWIKLDTKNQAIDLAPLAWAKLDATQQAIGIASTISGWSRLQVKNLTIKEGAQEIPDNFRKVNHVDYPASKTYSGPAERTSTQPFRVPLPEQLGAWFISSKCADAFAKSVNDSGRTILELDIYADTSPTFYTDFVVSVTYTNNVKAGVARVAMFWPVFVAVVIAALLVIGIIIAASILVSKVTDFVYGPPGKGSPLTTVLIVGGGILLIGGGLYTYNKSQSGKSK